jgi:hypothetical protein
VCARVPGARLTHGFIHDDAIANGRNCRDVFATRGPGTHQANSDPIASLGRLTPNSSCARDPHMPLQSFRRLAVVLALLALPSSIAAQFPPEPPHGRVAQSYTTGCPNASEKVTGQCYTYPETGICAPYLGPFATLLLPACASAT